MLTVLGSVHVVVEADIRLSVAADCEKYIYNIKHNLSSNDMTRKLY